MPYVSCDKQIKNALQNLIYSGAQCMWLQWMKISRINLHRNDMHQKLHWCKVLVWAQIIEYSSRMLTKSIKEKETRFLIVYHAFLSNERSKYLNMSSQNTSKLWVEWVEFYVRLLTLSVSDRLHIPHNSKTLLVQAVNEWWPSLWFHNVIISPNRMTSVFGSRPRVKIRIE